jgi:hypothetical protein
VYTYLVFVKSAFYCLMCVHAVIYMSAWAASGVPYGAYENVCLLSWHRSVTPLPADKQAAVTQATSWCVTDKRLHASGTYLQGTAEHMHIAVYPSSS